MAKRHVVVTGGGGGIGGAVARRFAADGCAVHLLGRNLERVRAMADALAAQTGAGVLAHACDLDDPLSVAAAFEALPRVDVLVNAAGSIARKTLHDSQPQDWRGPWTAKVLGTVEASRLALLRMRGTGGGVIVNIIGTAGVHLNPKSILTSTANAALIAFTQAAGALSVDSGVRVVGINPGLTRTSRVDDLVAGQGGEAYKALMADLPMQRMGTVEEIADCTFFLASDAAAYISGTVIDVDGGARWRM